MSGASDSVSAPSAGGWLKVDSLSADELMRLHVDVLFTHDGNGYLDRVNEPDGPPAPRFFLGRTRNGIIRRFRRDVSEDIRRELETASSGNGREGGVAESMSAREYEQILMHAAPVKKTWSGPAFCFPQELTATAAMLITEETAHLLEPVLAAWLPDVRRCQPMAALIVEGRAVAVCCSGRRTSLAHEAAVETAPVVRRRGYATQVVPMWARAVRELGRVPLYSTSWQNEGSLALARSLGLIQFGTDLHIT